MIKKMDEKKSMEVEEVTKFYQQLTENGIKVWIDGGWAVDAHIGKQTRPHGDLDIAIESKHVEKALQLLKMQGFKEIRRDNEWNFVVGDDAGREIDFHIFVLDDQGKIVDGIKYPEESLTGSGLIGDCIVDCISPYHLVQFHTGYPLRLTDYHDVSLLCRKFGLEYPKEYHQLKKTENEIDFLQSFKVEMISSENQEHMIAFLKNHDDYSLFLLGNFENYGPSLGEAPYSGNYKLIRLDSEIVAVLCLSKKGSLLIQSIIREPIFETVLAACLEEKIPITGLVGDWEFCHVFWQFLKNKKMIQTETFTSKEILYQANLSNRLPIPQSDVRLLEADDYTQWKPLRLDYLIEEGFPNDLSDEEMRRLFIDKCNKKIIWGFFLNNQLVSIADLNAKAFDLGQLGGVYTAPKFRQKGYSKAVICKLIADLKPIYNINKLIIFTGETNLPARKLYESIGVKQIGHFAILFGN
jgi:lincosamide nucleotidyltransferase A/C/D/E